MTTEEKVKWFGLATRFQLKDKIQLVMKRRVNGEGSWAIINFADNTVFNSNMEWESAEFEKRDEAFMIRTLFPLDSAMAQWEQYKMFAEDM